MLISDDRVRSGLITVQDKTFRIRDLLFVGACGDVSFEMHLKAVVPGHEAIRLTYMDVDSKKVKSHHERIIRAWENGYTMRDAYPVDLPPAAPFVLGLGPGNGMVEVEEILLIDALDMARNTFMVRLRTPARLSAGLGISSTTVKAPGVNLLKKLRVEIEMAMEPLREASLNVFRPTPAKSSRTLTREPARAKRWISA